MVGDNVINWMKIHKEQGHIRLNNSFYIYEILEKSKTNLIDLHANTNFRIF